MKTRKVLCVGVNPAFDVTLVLDGLDSDRVNRVVSERRMAAGKAANVACGLVHADIPCALTGCYGSDTYEEWRTLFERRIQGDAELIPIISKGSTRQNITLLHGGQTVKINRAGDSVDDTAVQRLSEVLGSRISRGDIAVFTGSIPTGMSSDEYISLMCTVGDAGGLIALDTDALSEEDVLRVKPWLYKPNAHELARLCAVGADDPDALIACAQRLVRCGVGTVLLTLGGNGLAAVTKEETVRVEPMPVDVVNTVGAGDAALAAFVAKYIRGGSLSECAHSAARAGEHAVSAGC